MIGVAVLGSTGSLGSSTLDVLARHPDHYRVVAMTANRDVEGMLRRARQHQPELIAMADPDAARRVQAELPQIEVLSGPAGLIAAVEHSQIDYVMAAIVGAAGLPPTLRAIELGRRILLANKEALVVAGPILIQTAKHSGAQILPIDSEHNAVFQCMPNGYRGLDHDGITRILLTASGGPFRTRELATLANVTPAEACAHPNWSMGRKISVDSATMMNKGLEVIEAHWLFAAAPQRIQVVVHPQSLIHSMVEYVDGSVLAQISNPDMRTPIAQALAWPGRLESGVAPLDLFEVARLDFEPPSPERFPCLGLAYDALSAGAGMPAILNAANEVAVAAFLAEKIGFTRIPEVIRRTMDDLASQDEASSIDALWALDAEARRRAEHYL